MAYTNNIPLSTQAISSTAAPINANFQALNSFGNGYAELSLQAAAPVFAGTSDGLYTRSFATTSNNELFVHRQGTSGTIEVPMTASSMSNNSAAACINGWTYLPSGLLMKWGTIAATTATVAVTPTVTSGGPNFTKVFRVQLTPRDTSTAVNFNCGQRTTPNDTSGNFNAYCANPTATTSIEYLILGI